ncbi:glycoside hydrolase family 3 N-terminal domain-containing protein [Acidobacteriota bacterium]
MKINKFGIIVILFILGLLLTACAPAPVRTGLVIEPAGKRWVNHTLSKMNLREKIAQMVACRYTGRFVNRNSEYYLNLKSLIQDQKIGGLILFGGEVYESAHLTNSFQELADIPLLIAADLERGLGNQLDRAVLFPPLMSLGATRSEELAYEMGRITALEARAVGIHMTYAPVVDVNINPENPIINTRSFGEDPQMVSTLAAAFIEGCQSHGLIATAKHFPGHGDTSEDSHTVLPTVKGDLERLETVELFPFRKVITAGVKAVMTAHLWLPALDPTPNIPATLSETIMTGLLRRDMGFSGLIVTDAMEMRGVTNLYTSEQAAVLAVKAGVDMLLLPPKPVEVIDAILRAVEEGEISEARIDDSVRRILNSKAQLGLHVRKTVDVQSLGRIIGRLEHMKQAAETFDRSMTVVKNDKNLIPLSGGGQRIAVFSLSSDPGGYFAGSTFMREMKKRVPDLIGFNAEPTTAPSFFEETLKTALKETDVLIFGLFSRLRSDKGSADIDHRQVEMIRAAIESGSPVAVISFGSPYFFRHFPNVDAYMCAYRYSEEAQVSAVRALFGEIDVMGQLPVSIKGFYEYGHGIKILKQPKSP